MDGPAKPRPLVAPATFDDPAVGAAAEKTRLSLRRRKGRASSVKTSQEDRLADVSAKRPEAQGAQLLGQSGK